MNPAKVVVGEVKAVGSPEVLPLLRESIRQPRKAAHLHSDREILAFHMGRANLRGIGVAHDWDLLRVRPRREGCTGAGPQGPAWRP